MDHDILVWTWIRILDPDPAIFVIDLQDASKKLIFWHNIFCLLLFEGKFTSFFKDKKLKESQNSRNQGFSYYFCMIIEGSGSRAGSGSIPLTPGSGSLRPKNMWIRWIWIWIWIRNTDIYNQWIPLDDNKTGVTGHRSRILATIKRRLLLTLRWSGRTRTSPWRD